MGATAGTLSITINFAPIARVLEDAEAAPEPKAIIYQGNEFNRTVTDGQSLKVDTVVAQFAADWAAYERELHSLFSAVVVFQRTLEASFPMPVAAVVISAEKYAARTASPYGVLSRSFATDKRGRAFFSVKLLDHPGETRPIPLSDWLRQGAKDIAWSVENTYFLGAETTVRA